MIKFSIKKSYSELTINGICIYNKMFIQNEVAKRTKS